MTVFNTYDQLPDYVVLNDPSSANGDVLRRPAEKVSFPLDEKTQKVIAFLEAKFEQEENCAGLAAPQIGYGKRIIILALEDDEDLKKHRPDLSDTMPKSILINPSYAPLGEEMSIDWEACFSVGEVAGQVARFTEITYEAWTPKGTKVTGKARGFLARLLQHEIDHTDGKLFIDYVPEEELVTFAEMRKMRGQA